MSVQIVLPPFDSVDTVAQVPLGTTGQDEFGNTYIYLAGVAATVAGSAVAYNAATFATTLTVAASAGMVAFAQAATVAATFGWYLIDGTGVSNNNGAVVANAAVFITAVAGAVDDAVVATDRIENAYFASATGAAGPGTVTVHYPQAIGLG